jgi:signal transduction histidine kinase
MHYLPTTEPSGEEHALKASSASKPEVARIGAPRRVSVQQIPATGRTLGHPMQADDMIPFEAEESDIPRRRRITAIARLLFTRRGDRPPERGGRGRVWADTAFARYGLAVVFVMGAIAGAVLIEIITGRFVTFPFYAAVVAGAWLGIGPGCLSLLLSSLVVEDVWTPPLFNLRIDLAELPSFIAFVLFALMCLAWSSQRRRAHRVLEATVRERTSDLVRTNAALQIEIAERTAAEEERRRTERALRDAEAELARTLRLATVAELAATIAHEINQPLAAIVANGAACSRSLAQQPPLLDTAREAAGCIVADGHRAGDVIARIRSLFNKEAPKWRPLDINDVIREVVRLSRSAIDRQRIALQLDLAPSPPLVMGDRVQLQQVLVNLVTNALEAMAELGDRPSQLMIRSRAERGEAAVSVEDSGRGLDLEQEAHLFDSFYTTKPDGIGVGLAISRSIIEAHGGSMSAKPGERHGARFGFTLPLAGAADRPGA